MFTSLRTTSQLRSGLSSVALVWFALGVMPPAAPGLLVDRAPRHLRIGGLRVLNCGSQRLDSYGVEVLAPEPGTEGFGRTFVVASVANDEPTQRGPNLRLRRAVALRGTSTPPERHASWRTSALAAPSRFHSHPHAAVAGRGPPAL